MSDQRADPRPSWKKVLAKHGITTEQVAHETQMLITLSYEDALRVAMEATGTPTQVDTVLLALSRLAKVDYSRRNVGGFTFIASERDDQKKLNIPAGTLKHALDSLGAHGMVIQDTVYPPAQLSGKPEPYLIVSFPLGTLLAFEEPGASSRQVLTPDDLTAYFPDGYILHTHLTRKWGIAYYVVLSHQYAPMQGPAKRRRKQRKENA